MQFGRNEPQKEEAESVGPREVSPGALIQMSDFRPQMWFPSGFCLCGRWLKILTVKILPAIASKAKAFRLSHLAANV